MNDTESRPLVHSSGCSKPSHDSDAFAGFCSKHRNLNNQA